MANISITIPDAMAPRVEAAFKEQYNYQEQIPDPKDLTKIIANPETTAQFMRRMIREYIKEITVAHESSGAGESARDNAATKARADFG